MHLFCIIKRHGKCGLYCITNTKTKAMKRTVITLTILAAIGAIASCKKSDNKSTPTTSTATFTSNGATFSEVYCKDTLYNDFFGRQGYALVAGGTTSDKLHVAEILLFFPGSTRPTAGTYTVGLTTVAQPNQVSILINDSTSSKQGLYGSDSVTSLKVVVTSNNGKLSAVVPSMKLTGLTTPTGGTTYNDSVTASGTLIEQ
jgi:hypothetical protein